MFLLVGSLLCSTGTAHQLKKSHKNVNSNCGMCMILLTLSMHKSRNDR